MKQRQIDSGEAAIVADHILSNTTTTRPVLPLISANAIPSLLFGRVRLIVSCFLEAEILAYHGTGSRKRLIVINRSLLAEAKRGGESYMRLAMDRKFEAEKLKEEARQSSWLAILHPPVDLLSKLPSSIIHGKHNPDGGISRPVSYGGGFAYDGVTGNGTTWRTGVGES